MAGGKSRKSGGVSKELINRILGVQRENDRKIREGLKRNNLGVIFNGHGAESSIPPKNPKPRRIK